MPEQEGGADGGTSQPQSPEGDRDCLFTQFSEATGVDEILSTFRALCQEIKVEPDGYENVYPSLKAGLTSWKPVSIWELLNARAALPEYDSQNACRGRRVLVVGAGPVGLRMAIEAALLGAKVDLVEKRGCFSRSNSLHLWPFLITDLRNLGAKKFYGKFATGSLDHICIRILQGFLLKVCLILGIRVHMNTTFDSLVEPTSSTGWRVSTQPSSCPVTSMEFDAVLAADGKKNSLPGFKLKEFRAKLALAITANFVNGNTQHENSVPEISGVSYVYSMDFFNSLSEKYGIELENIVYYKDETHYFVMTAKKPSLLKKGVLKKEYNDPKQLLSSSNIDMTALKKYTVEAAGYSTKGALPLTFLKNHRGEDDVALFDFTSLFASENAARIVERKGRKILLCVAGDSLNEPFWPTGSGLGRGYLGAFDAVWMLKRFTAGTPPLELVEEREALFYLLPQTTPERLAKNLTGYTIDPKTRYPNLSELVPTGDVSHLYDTDNPSAKPLSITLQQRPSPPIQEERPPLIKAASVAGGLSWKRNKRSRSSENLTALAESIPLKKTASPSRTGAETVSSPTERNQANLQEKIKMFRARENKSPGGGKSAETEKKKEEIQIKQQKSVSPKPPEPQERRKQPESPKAKQKGVRRFFSKSPTPSSEEEAKEKENTKETRGKKVTKSPPPAKQENTRPKPSGHPLSVTKQAATASASTETEQKDKSERNESGSIAAAPASVADIVKRLDPQSPSMEDSTQKDKKKRKGRKEGKAKDKDKERSKDASKEKGRSEGKSGSRFSFLKPKKQSYDVAKASSRTSSSPKLKKKRKKTKNEAAAEVQELSERPQLSLQQKIDRLKELGVGKLDTDGDGSAMILSLEELRDFEMSGALAIEGEDTGEGVGGGGRGIGERSKSPAGDSEDGLESAESNRSRSSTPLYSSGVDEGRSGSRASQASTGAATYGLSSRGVSPVDGEWKLGLTSGEEEGSVEEEDETLEAREELGAMNDDTFVLDHRLSVSETIRLLEPLSSSYSYDQIAFRKQTEQRKSKEFELAELQMQYKADSSSPLWLARIIQGMGKCLERLRKEQDGILATKTTLQILNTIFSNVQLYPTDDTYRRVRVSSQRFNQKVWQFSSAAQFLARAGWVEIGDYIVLPMGQTVENAKRVLDKHLNIVNQMLWSCQLELPDAPSGVARKEVGGVSRRHRTITAAMVARRQSYSSRVVAESLIEVEEEQEAIEAELVRMNSSQSGRDNTKEPTPDSIDGVQVSEEREEEARTMRAASAARSKWLERQRLESQQQMKEREYKLMLESELYDLPLQSFLHVQAESSSTVKSPSPGLSVTPDPRSTSPSSTSPTEQEMSESSEMGKEAESEQKRVEMIIPDPLLIGSSSQTTDAQYSTPDSIRQNMIEYEKITLEAAAQVRQKWNEA